MRAVVLAFAAIALAGAQPAKKIDINSAFQTELEKLPGISRTLAKKIISNRPYETVDDLKRAGVPAATIAKIKPLVRCDTGPHAEPGHGVVPPRRSSGAH